MDKDNGIEKINKKDLLGAFKADMKSAEVLRKETDEDIARWKREYNGEKYGNEQKGKSQIVSRDIKKQDEWAHPSLIDPFVSTQDIIKASPITWEDKDSARQNELILNTQFCRKFNRYSFMTKSVKILSQEGTVIIQTGWDYEDKEVESEQAIISIDENGYEYISGYESVTETVITKNQPTAKACRNEDVFLDPTCQDDMDKCQFVIYRYESDMSSLREDGRYKNLKKVAREASGLDTEIDYESEDDTFFRFKDSARKKLVVHEYWGNYDINGDGIAEAVVCKWVGNTIIMLQDNPYPDKKPPFLVVPFNSVPFKLQGEANAELISDNQKIKTAITRGIVDNMAQSNNGQVGIRSGAISPRQLKIMEAGKNFSFEGTPADFWQGSFNPIPGSAFDMLAIMNNEIESITGTKSFSGGISGSSLGGTATGARGALDATSTRRLNLVRNIAENLVKPLMRKWMSYNSEFLEEEEVVRITNEEFVPVRRDDLSGRVDIEITVSTSEDNQAKAQELSFMMQTMGQELTPVQLRLLADWADLVKLPDQAKRLREDADRIEQQMSQPDPFQEQMKQIELEKAQLGNEKLKAEIAQMYSESSENEADKAEKMAQAEHKRAQTRKLNSESDLKDLEFVRIDEEVDHNRDMEKKDFDRLANLDQMVLQAQMGSENEQIGVSK